MEIVENKWLIGRSHDALTPTAMVGAFKAGSRRASDKQENVAELIG